MKKLIASLSLLSIAATGGNFLFSLPAQAANGSSCYKSGDYISASSGTQYAPGVSVVYNNQTSSTQNAIINFSADVAMTSGASINVSYAIDNTYPGEYAYGPGNFANYLGAQGAYETRSTIAVIPVPPGSHTIKPVWRVVGGQSSYGYMYNPCMTVSVP